MLQIPNTRPLPSPIFNGDSKDLLIFDEMCYQICINTASKITAKRTEQDDSLGGSLPTIPWRHILLVLQQDWFHPVEWYLLGWFWPAPNVSPGVYFVPTSNIKSYWWLFVHICTDRWQWWLSSTSIDVSVLRFVKMVPRQKSFITTQYLWLSVLV